MVPPAQSNMSVGHNYLVSDVLCWLLQNYGSKVFITCSLHVLNLWKSIKVMLSHFISAIFVDLAISVHKIQPVLRIEVNFGVRELCATFSHIHKMNYTINDANLLTKFIIDWPYIIPVILLGYSLQGKQCLLKYHHVHR